MYELKIIKTISEFDQNLWDSIVKKDNIISSYNFLKAVEESNINDCNFFYVVVYKNNNIVAHTCLFTMSMDLFILSRGIIKKIVDVVRKLFHRFCLINIIECGSPVALGNIISVNIKENQNKNEILGLIIDSAEALAKDNRSKLIIFRDYYGNDNLSDKEFLKYNFSRANILPNVEINIDWNSFNDYIGSLRYNYRRFVKKCLLTLDEESILIEYLFDYKEYIPTLKKLYQNCYNNAKEYRREILTEDFFDKTNTYLQKKSMVILLKKGKEVLGFSFFLLDDYTARLLYIGMNYEKNKEYLIYFNIFFSGLKFAIENNYKKIELGVTTYDFKMRIGGKIVSLYAYMKQKNKLLNFVLKNTISFLFPKKKLEIKHPFHIK
jgi:predicted N-acyltransferase